MSATRSLFGRACGVSVCLAVSVMAWTPVAAAAESVLFPAALHITRELFDPIAQNTSVIDEYCQGNRMISVSGKRTAIADYGRGELTEIDFTSGTYSITKFEQLARVYAQGETAALPLQASAASRNEWRVRSKGGSVVASRPAETFEAEKQDGGSRRVIRVSADRELALNRSAMEALLGIGYPYPPNDNGAMILGALHSHERDRKSTRLNSSHVEISYA